MRGCSQAAGGQVRGSSQAAGGKVKVYGLHSDAATLSFPSTPHPTHTDMQIPHGHMEHTDVQVPHGAYRHADPTQCIQACRPHMEQRIHVNPPRNHTPLSPLIHTERRTHLTPLHMRTHTSPPTHTHTPPSPQVPHGAAGVQRCRRPSCGHGATATHPLQQPHTQAASGTGSG